MGHDSEFRTARVKEAVGRATPAADSPRAEGVDAIRAYALSVFESAAAAADWLDEPNPALGGRTADGRSRPCSAGSSGAAPASTPSLAPK